MAKSKGKILIVTPALNGFIRGDIEILSSQYEEKVNWYNWSNKLLTLPYMGLQFLSLLFNIWSTRLIVVEFGGHWALVPSFFGKLFNVPVIIVLHGTDCASLPHINYGSLRKSFLRFTCEMSYKLATVLVPVSDSLMYTKNDYDSENIEQGLSVHFPNLTTDYQVIPNGLDAEFWQIDQQANRDEKRFITVIQPGQFVRKGGDLVVQLAEQRPECSFYIVGCTSPDQFIDVPDNVHFVGKLSREQLRDQFTKASYYLQLSMFEGFGLSLCEAMLCGCIPIGSSVNAIPEIIGDTGFILKTKDVNKLQKIIETAEEVDEKEQLRIKARNRIVSKFAKSIRKQQLLNLAENLQKAS